MTLLPPHLLFPAMVAVFTAGQTAAGEQVFRHDYEEHPGTFVEVESVFGAVAKQGSLPYRITLRNESGLPRAWTVTLSEGNQGRSVTTKATRRFEVESGAEVVHEVILPFGPAFLAYDYRSLEIEVSAPGLGSESRQTGQQTPADFPMIGVSRALAERSLARLDAAVRKANPSNPCFGKPFEPAHLPVDWTGYTGLDVLLLDEPAWKALTSAQRQALVAWIRLGGRLDLYGVSAIEPSSLGLPIAAPEGPDLPAALSLGRIYCRLWDGREIPEEYLSHYWGAPQAAGAFNKEFQQNWGLQSEFGIKDFNPTLVFLLLLAFAILVAPVNLFYLAKPGQRHRLFVTTPLISLATCLLIVFLIFFIDGVGGKGHRVVLADLQAGKGENRLYFTQEQISRTGVIFSSGFETKRPFEINPANLPPSHFNPLSQNGRRFATFEIKGGIYEGEFFRSRSEQAFSLRAAEPGRARIEAVGEDGGTPVLISNLAQEIVAFVYRDPKGELWTCAAGTVVSPGQRIPLERSASTAVPEWLSETAALFSKSRRDQIEALDEPNRFFAQVGDPETLALPTHPAVRWEKTALLLTGTPSGEIAPTP